MAYQAISLSELQDRLRQKRDGILQWTYPEATLALNEALRFWNLLTGRWRRTVLLDSGVNQIEYDLPASMIYGMRVTATGVPLVITSSTELDLTRPDWRSETVSTGGDVPDVPVLWVPCSLQRIAIWPALDSVITSALLIDGVSATPILVEDNDKVDIGSELLDLILNYCLHLLAFKLGGPTWVQTRPFYKQLLKAAAEENGVLKANQNYRRWAGLDRRIDLQKAKGVRSALDGLGKI